MDDTSKIVGTTVLMCGKEPGTSRRVLRVPSVTIRMWQGNQVVRLPLVSIALEGADDSRVN